jgi:predicted nucleic acid-binding protein
VAALELLYSARSAADYEALAAALAALPWVPTTQDALRRALDVQRQLAARG